MAILKYKVITSKIQYREYAKILEDLVFSGSKDRSVKEEISLLTVLIEKWDGDHNSFDELAPIPLLQSLMKARGMKPKDLVPVLNISKGYMSDILHYKKGLSKEVIRKLASHFKLSQEAFIRPYTLATSVSDGLRNTRLAGKKKELTASYRK